MHFMSANFCLSIAHRNTLQRVTLFRLLIRISPDWWLGREKHIYYLFDTSALAAYGLETVFSPLILPPTAIVVVVGHFTCDNQEVLLIIFRIDY